MRKIFVFLLCLSITLFGGCNSYKFSENLNPPIQNQPSTPPLDNNIPNEDEFVDNDEEEKKKKLYISSKTNSLRIRSGAGSTYKILGSLDKNDMLLYVGTQGNYYQTNYKEQTAFVHKDYCELVELEMANDQIEKAVDFGSTLLGYPYVWGSQRYHWGNGKLNANFVNGEFDCSAFVQYIYYVTNGVILDVTSRSQSLNGTKVDSDLQRGDLMFFTNASRKDKVGLEKIGHVGIFLGGNYILHTASDHAVIEPISNTRWSYFLTARRVV